MTGTKTTASIPAAEAMIAPRYPFYLAGRASEQEAALRLGRIGFDHVKGYLRSGMEALASRPDLVWPTERISAPMVAEELANADPPLVLVLPGSRSSEIRLLLEIFGAAIAEVGARIGPMELVLPTVPHVLPKIHAGVASWPVRPRIVVEPAEKWAAFRQARGALAASGTVTLELALAGIPTVGAYRVTPFEELVARIAGIAKLPTVILANMVIGDNVVPEFLQRACTPAALAGALVPILSDTPQRRRQVEAFARLDDIMVLDAKPSAKAATIVLDLARHGRAGVAAAMQ